MTAYKRSTVKRGKIEWDEKYQTASHVISVFPRNCYVLYIENIPPVDCRANPFFTVGRKENFEKHCFGIGPRNHSTLWGMIYGAGFQEAYLSDASVRGVLVELRSCAARSLRQGICDEHSLIHVAVGGPWIDVANVPGLTLSQGLPQQLLQNSVV